MTAKTTTRCFCQSFEFGEFDGENENAVSYDTDCTETTSRVFAQGHDAKLAGYLVRAEMAGEEIRLVEGGVAISFAGAVSAASKVSDAFTAKVQAMLDAARARVAKKAAGEARKTARKSARAAAVAAPAEPEIVKAKVGRWTYEGVVGPVTRDFVYRNKLGQMKSAPEGKYTLV